MQIAGSTVLLTGATGGLGQAIARALAGRGADLVLTGRRADVLEPLARECAARALTVDLAERREVQRLIEQAGEIDILVANAALPGSGPLESFTVEELDRVLDVNLRAPIALAHAFLPRMAARRSGHLVFMSSLSGKAVTTGQSLYITSKFGLRGFAAALRSDLHGTGVGVSAIFPGFIREAGMFAEAEVELPAVVGTRTPQEVASAVVKAIEHNRGELDVASPSLRLGTLFANVAPETADRLARLLGSQRIAREMEAAQRGKR